MYLWWSVSNGCRVFKSLIFDQNSYSCGITVSVPIALVLCEQVCIYIYFK